MRTPDFSAVSIFCEDVRREIEGQRTLVGLLPDNLLVSAIPSLMPKLGLYTRILISSDRKLTRSMFVHFRSPSGKVVSQTELGLEMIEKAQADSRQQGSALTTMLSDMLAGPFPINESGRFVCIVECEGEEVLAGSLRIEAGDAPPVN